MNMSLVTMVYADPKRTVKPSKQHHVRGGGAHFQPRTSNRIVNKLYPKRTRLF